MCSSETYGLMVVCGMLARFVGRLLARSNHAAL